VLAGYELEIVVVPCKPQAGLAAILMHGGKPGGEGPPAGFIGRPQLLGDMRADQGADAERLGDAAGGGEIALQHVEGEVTSRHGQAATIEHGTKAGRVVIETAESFDLRITCLCDHGEDVFPWLEFAGGVKLE